MKEELTAQEAADYLGLDEVDMLEWIEEGGGPHYLMTRAGKPVYRLNQLKEFRSGLLAEYLKDRYLKDGVPGMDNRVQTEQT